MNRRLFLGSLSAFIAAPRALFARRITTCADPLDDSAHVLRAIESSTPLRDRRFRIATPIVPTKGCFIATSCHFEIAQIAWVAASGAIDLATHGVDYQLTRNYFSMVDGGPVPRSAPPVLLTLSHGSNI